jgi:hypothetical protein
MAIVTVKNKCQGVSVGDVFEAKSVVDQGVAESMAEFRAGKSFGPFATHKQFLASLHKEAKKVSTKKSKRRVR